MSRQTSSPFVTEQSGFFWSSTILLSSLFFGLAFRTTFSAEQITKLVEQASQKIHPHVSVQFESAHLSLSDGLFPEFAVIVENITATSDLECQMSPVLTLDQIRLPLSFSNLILGRVKLSTVELGHGDLVLHNIPAHCYEQKIIAKVAPKVVDSVGQSSAVVLPSKFLLDETSSHPVDRVYIHSLRLHGPVENFAGFELRRVSIDANFDTNKTMARGQLILPLESLAGDYDSKADFILTLEEPGKEQSSRLSLAANGIWREGQYDFQISSELEKRTFEYDLKASHLPLSQFLSLLKKQKILNLELDGKQEWISFRLASVGLQKAEVAQKIDLHDFKLEGDLGEFSVSKVSIQSLSPLLVQPFQLSAQGVRLSRLLDFFERREVSPIFAELGQFNGVLSFESEKKFEIQGENSGLQFVFSNRGHRELQTMSLLGGHLKFEGSEWKAEIDRIRPLDGLFLGKVTAHADHEFKHVHFQLDVDEMSLAPEVQKLMSGGGSLGAWSGALSADLQFGKLQKAKGQFLINGLDVENLKIRKTQLQILKEPIEDAKIRIELSGQDLELAPPSPLFDVLGQINLDSAVRSDHLKLQIESNYFQDLSWKLLGLKINNENLKSEGGWSSDGKLYGQIKRSAPTAEKKWQIQGTRSKPIFTEVHSK